MRAATRGSTPVARRRRDERRHQPGLGAPRDDDHRHPLYLKIQPTALTARIMARMSEGYSAFASDPQFRTVFKY